MRWELHRVWVVEAQLASGKRTSSRGGASISTRTPDLERLRREYEMGASLDLDCAVRPYGLDTYEGMPTLVLEDFGGEPLERLAMPMPPERFLDLAVSTRI